MLTIEVMLSKPDAMPRLRAEQQEKAMPNTKRIWRGAGRRRLHLYWQELVVVVEYARRTLNEGAVSGGRQSMPARAMARAHARE